jgi:hypothetical protein
MAKGEIENRIQVIERLPRIFQKDEDFLKNFIKNKVKEGLRDGFKDLMKESFNEILGERRVKEILQDREQAKKERQKKAEMKKWLEEFQAKKELEKYNPTLDTKEVAEILGIATCTVINFMKRKYLKGERDGSFGWQFRKREVEAFKSFSPDLIRRRRKRYARKVSKSFNTDHTDPYMTPLELEEKGISPFTSFTLIKYIKKDYIEHKTYCTTKGRMFYYVRVNHLKELLNNPPDWLKKSLKHSEACSP